MNAGQHDVELTQNLIRVIELAIPEDVHLGACPDLDALHVLPCRLNQLDILERPLFVQAVGNSYRLGMVGNKDVAVAQPLGGSGHLFHTVAAVRSRGMHLQIAADIGEFHEPRQLALLGSFHLAQVLAQLGGNPSETQLDVDFLFGLTGQDFLSLEQAVLGELPAAPLGTVAQRHVVLLRTGKILQCRAVRLRREHADVHLQTVRKLGARFILALDQNLAYAREFQEVVGETSQVATCNQQVKVANRLTTAAQGACGCNVLHAAELAKIGVQFLRQLRNRIQSEASRNSVQSFDGLQNVLLRFFIHSGEFAQSAGLGRGFQFLDGLDVELTMEKTHLLRPHGLQLQQVQQRARNLFQLILMVLALPGVEQFMDLVG